MLTSRYFPAWYLGRNPDHRVVLASYEAGIASNWGSQARDALNEFGPPLFGVKPYARGRVDDWRIEGREGGMLTTGVGGALTGRGADVLIIDDPVKNAEEANSIVLRTKTMEWFQSTAYTRLEPGGVCILIMTRWHPEDLAGQLIEEMNQGGEDWAIIRMPAVMEADIPDLVPLDLQKANLQRDVGEPLWPERFGNTPLNRIKRTLGTYYWNALYQQIPQQTEGGMIQRDWFRIVKREHVPMNVRWHRFYDLATSERKTADYTASIEAAYNGETLYLRDMIRGQWEWPRVRSTILAEMRRSPNTVVGIEKQGMQTALIQDLQRQPESRRTALYGVPIDRDKVTRAQAWIARAEAGNVCLVEGGWIEDFYDEADRFPGGKHDDQIDAVSGASMMATRGSSSEITEDVAERLRSFRGLGW